MKKGFDWNGTIDNIQFVMLWFIIFVVVVCVSVLILFDILAGAGVMNYLTNGNSLASFFISLATSGLLISLMFLSYNFGKKNNGLSIGFIIGAIAFLVYCLDVYFDSMTADYLRFGQIMILKEIPNYQVQLLFRLLIGGISTVGESLAMAIIVGMPVLKEIINKAVPESLRTPQHTQNNTSKPPYPPSSLPRQQNYPQPQQPRPQQSSARPEMNRNQPLQSQTPQMRKEPLENSGEPTYHPISYGRTQKDTDGFHYDA